MVAWYWMIVSWVSVETTKEGTMPSKRIFSSMFGAGDYVEVTVKHQNPNFENVAHASACWKQVVIVLCWNAVLQLTLQPTHNICLENNRD
jgi:hypothetical protein